MGLVVLFFIGWAIMGLWDGHKVKQERVRERALWEAEYHLLREELRLKSNPGELDPYIDPNEIYKRAQQKLFDNNSRTYF